MPHYNEHIDSELNQQDCSKPAKNLEGIPFNLLINNSYLSNFIVNELNHTNYPLSSNNLNSENSSLSFNVRGHGLGRNI
jgi:hypothetical protein